MNRTLDEKLYDVWNRKWTGDKPDEHLTRLGRWMFRSKKKHLSEVINNLTVQSIIEVGCGLGHTMSIYEDLKLNYIGIDVSPNAVEICRKKGLHAIQQHIEDVRETYDLVSSDGMLEHFLNFEPYAKHLMRISNRYVLLIQPNHESFLGQTLAYLSELLQPDKNVFEYNYRIQDFISTFEMNEFKLKKNIPIFWDVFRLLLFQRESSKGHPSIQ